MYKSSIKERTSVGRKVYVLNGGMLGRITGAIETNKDFLQKPTSKNIAKEIKKGFTIRQVAKLTNANTKTVIKVKS